MKKTLLFLFWILCQSAFMAAQNPMIFSSKDNYKIVVGRDCDDASISAANELGSMMEKIFGKHYEIVSDRKNKGGKYISIGSNRFSDELYNKYRGQIRDDGFLIHSENGNLYIIATEPVALQYGVSHFLENYIGCVYASSNCLYFEKMPDGLTLGDIHDLQNPSFRYREVYQLIPNEDPHYALWHKLHNRSDFDREWGLFVHTFKTLVPVEKYFDSHPEWFSELLGRRVRDGQLCLSNPEVLEVLCANLKTEMEKEPTKKIWSVSQNDNESSCTCPACKHLDSLYGGPSGTMVWFVNQVAARFPDKTISTLAYQQTRHAPKNIRPANNVNIMLCSIECPRNKPIADDVSINSFQNDLRDWTSLTNNIFLWDYVVQFRNYLDPFPNLHVLQPNLQNFRNHGVPMIFEQGSNPNVTENHEWRTYLIAHLLWNVDEDVDQLRDKFLSAYYGADRAGYIKAYYDTMCQSLLESRQTLSIYGYPVDASDGYLAPDKIDYYRSLFAKAYKTSPYSGCPDEDLAVFNDHLRLLELSLDYAVLDLSFYDISPELSYFTFDSLGHKVVKSGMLALAQNFFDDCDRLGVKKLDEAKYTPQQMLDNIHNYVAKQTGVNKALHRSVLCSTKWSNIYDVGGPKALTDGKAGVMNYYYNWLGFQGNDMDVVVDLGDSQDIEGIQADFLFYPLSWIFAPRKVTCYVSDNQKDWVELSHIDYDNEEILTECKIVNFKLDVSAKARYVRLRANSLLTNPEWHRGVGQPCWIFCDEIVVR